MADGRRRGLQVVIESVRLKAVPADDFPVPTAIVIRRWLKNALHNGGLRRTLRHAPARTVQEAF